MINTLSLEDIYGPQHNRLIHKTLARFNKPQDREDAFQAFLTHVIQHNVVEKYNPEFSPTTYLSACAYTFCLSNYRSENTKKRKGIQISLDSPISANAELTVKDTLADGISEKTIGQDLFIAQLRAKLPESLQGTFDQIISGECVFENTNTPLIKARKAIRRKLAWYLI